MRSGRTKRDKVRAIINRQRSVKVAAAPLEKFWRRVRDELGLAETELVICFVTDAEIARMNWAFRKKRGPTDVLSFPAEKQRTRRSSGFFGGDDALSLRGAGQAGAAITAKRSAALAKSAGPPVSRYLGDIAISPATARRYATKNGRSFPAELRILMLHGVLHLLGYDHESDRGEMNRLEAKLRRRFGLA